jgi:hypothetical protein
VQLHIDRRARRVPPCVGQRLLDDAVGGQLDPGVEGGGRAAQDEPGAGRRGVPGHVDELVELSQAGLGLPDGRVRVGVFTQHAEQPPHLGQRGPRGVANGQQPLRPGRGHARGGQPGRLGLHGDHRDVVRDHVVQLASDPGPLAARQVLGQAARDGLAGRALLGGLSPGPLGDPGQGRGRAQRGQQDGQHRGLRADRTDQRHDQERHGQRHGQHLGTGAAEPVQGDELGRRAAHGQRFEQGQRQHTGQGDRDRGRRRAQERQRQRGEQAQHDQHRERPRVPARAHRRRGMPAHDRGPGELRAAEHLGHGQQAQQATGQHRPARPGADMP